VTFLALCARSWSATPVPGRKLGLAAKVGVMQRPERIVFLGAGALLHPIALKIAIWMVPSLPTSPPCSACVRLQTGCGSASRRKQDARAQIRSALQGGA